MIKIAGAGSGLLASLVTYNLSCFADDGAVTTPGSGTGSMFGMISQVVLFLLLILGLFYVMIRLLSKRNQQVNAGRAVKTLGGVTLGQNKSMQVVEVGHRLFVIGVGDNVQLLDTIDDPEEIEYIRERMNVAGQVKLDKLFSWTKRFQSGGQQELEEELPATSFQQVFHDKLSRLSNRRQDAEQLMQDEQQDRVNRP